MAADANSTKFRPTKHNVRVVISRRAARRHFWGVESRTRQVRWAQSTKRAHPDSICRLLEAISSRLEVQNSHRQHFTSETATTAGELSFIRNLGSAPESKRGQIFHPSCPLFPFNNSPTAHTRTKGDRVLCANRYVILLVWARRMISRRRPIEKVAPAKDVPCV